MTNLTEKSERNTSIALLLLRLTFGGLMLFSHGWGKMMKFFGEDPIRFANPLGIGEIPTLALAVFAEVICAVLIIVGFKTRMATIPLIITMLVAIFVVHISDPFNKMEFAILYLVPYVAILLAGPGKFSVDAFIGKE